MPSPREQWQQLTRTQKGALATVAAVDLALRAWSLADLARRPDEQVHGPRWLWGAGLAVGNTAGMLPAAYLLWGRRA